MSLAAAALFAAAAARDTKTKDDAFHMFGLWDDEDLDSLGLNKFGINPMAEARAKAIAVRKFIAYVEDWEHDCIQKQDVENEHKLLQKYGGIKFKDGEEHFTINKIRMQYVSKKEFRGYNVLACRDSYDPTTHREEDYELFPINRDLHGLIYEYHQEKLYVYDEDIDIIAQTGDIYEDGDWAWSEDDNDDDGGGKQKAKPTAAEKQQPAKQQPVKQPPSKQPPALQPAKQPPTKQPTAKQPPAPPAKQPAKQPGNKTKRKSPRKRQKTTK